MNRNLAIRLLRIELEHERRVNALEAADLDCDKWHISIWEVVLDKMGIPQDNTLEMTKKHGGAAMEHPDCFCRDHGRDKWFEAINSGEDDPVPTYVDWLIEDKPRLTGALN